MANYDANIRVNADTKRAESQLTKLEQVLNKLGDFTLKLDSRGLQGEVNKIGQSLRGIGERGALGGITLAAGKATTALGGVAAKFGVLGAAAASAGATINSALGGVPAVVGDILNQVGQIPSAMGLAAVAAMAFAPQLTKAAAGAVKLGAAIDNAVGGSTVNKIAGVVDKLGEVTTEINAANASFEQLLGGSSLNQLVRALNDAQRQAGRFVAFSDESVTAVEQLLSVERLLTREKRAQAALINQVNRDARLQRAAIEQNLIASRNSRTGSGFNQFSAVANSLADSRAVDKAIRRNWEKRMRDAAANMQPATSPLALPSSEMLFAGGRRIQRLTEDPGIAAGRAFTAELQRSVGAAKQLDGIFTAVGKSLGYMTRNVEAGARVQRSWRDALREMQGISAQLNPAIVPTANQYNRPAGPRPAPGFGRNQQNTGIGPGGRLESLALGVGFPLLFGGGAGSVLGAAAGSFVGSGFGGQILGSAIGQALDRFAIAAANAGKALRDPITNLQQIADAGLLAGRSQAFYAQKLIEVGRATEAAAIVQGEIIRKIGASGLRDLQTLGKSSDDLSKAWAEFNLQLQAALAGPLAGLIKWVTELIAITNGQRADAARVRDVRNGLSGADRAAFDRQSGEIMGLTRRGMAFGGISLDEAGRRQRALAESFAGRARIQRPGVQLGPEAAEQQLRAQRQTADEIKSAYREGFQLQRAAIDLERQGADLRRRIADDIFNKQQQVLRSQIEADRLRRQLAIETVDLEYQRRISKEEGRAAQVLEAEAALMRTRAQGEAELEARRKTLELDIAKQQRDTQNYVYQLSRDIDNIRRSTLQHEMDVADYRLKIERQIQDHRRLDAAASGAAAGVGSGAVGSAGFTANQLTLATREAAKFTGVANMCSESVKAFYKSLGMSLPGVTAWADTVRKAGTVMKDWSKLRPGDIVATGRPGDTTHVGVYTGGNNVFHQSRSRGLVSGNFPDLNYFKQGGYFVRPNATTGNLNNAASAIRRPNVPMVGASGVAGTMASLDAQDARIKREQLTLQEQLNKLGEEAATQRLLEVARGPKDLEQRRQAVALAKAELDVVVPGSRVVQERLAFEAQSLVKLQQRRDIDTEILKNTKLQGTARKDLEAALAEGLRITEQQIALDREALKLAQDKAYAVERAALESQLGVTGQGRAAGFMGNAAGAYENALLQYGDPARAKEIAKLTEQIDLARMASDSWRTSMEGVGTAFGDLLTTGVASVVGGTQAAQEVFASFLNSIAQMLMQTASQMISTYITLGIARMFATGGSAPLPTGSINLSGGIFQGFANNGSGIPLAAGFRANGGPVTGGLPYVVGERGPELFVPGTSGTIIPNNAMGGNNVRVDSISITVENTGDQLSPQAQKQIAGQVRGIVLATLVDQQRSGGVLR